MLVELDAGHLGNENSVYVRVWYVSFSEQTSGGIHTYTHTYIHAYIHFARYIDGGWAHRCRTIRLNWFLRARPVP